jgi:TetR/AcrR family transcriptional regulator, cholesterol catabolism regulator
MPRRGGGGGQNGRRRGTQTWENILAAAGEIFYERGYEGTSLQQIADSVGVEKASLYHYIKSKDDILYTLVMRALDRHLALVEESEETAGAGAPERLRQFINRWMALSWELRSYGEWTIVAEREFTRLEGKYLEEVIQKRDACSRFVKQLLKQGVEDGDFDPTLDLSVATTVIFEIMFTTPESPLTLEDLSTWYAQFIVRGLGNIPGSTSARRRSSKRELTSR